MITTCAVGELSETTECSKGEPGKTILSAAGEPSQTTEFIFGNLGKLPTVQLRRMRSGTKGFRVALLRYDSKHI